MASGRSDRGTHPAGAQDPDRRRVRRRQDHAGRRGQRDPCRCRRRRCSPTPGIGTDDLDGVEGKTTTTVAMDFGRITHQRRPRALPVRHARAGPVLVPVGRAGARRAGRGRAGRHPAAGRLLPVGRLLRAARHAVPGGGELLRRRAAAQRRTRSARRWTSTRTCRWCSATPGTGDSSKEVLIALVEHVMTIKQRTGTRASAAAWVLISGTAVVSHQAPRRVGPIATMSSDASPSRPTRRPCPSTSRPVPVGSRRASPSSSSARPRVLVAAPPGPVQLTIAPTGQLSSLLLSSPSLNRSVTTKPRSPRRIEWIAAACVNRAPLSRSAVTRDATVGAIRCRWTSQYAATCCSNRRRASTDSCHHSWSSWGRSVSTAQRQSGSVAAYRRTARSRPPASVPSWAKLPVAFGWISRCDWGSSPRRDTACTGARRPGCSATSPRPAR